MPGGTTRGIALRILQVAPPWFPVPPHGYGGTEQVVADLTDGLVAGGHDVTLLATADSVTSAELWSLYDRGASPAHGDPLVELPHLLHAYLRRERFDIIHDHTLLGTTLAVTAGRGGLVHTLHGAWSTLNAHLYAQLAPPASLVAISHDQASRAHADVPITGVIHNGVSLERFPFHPEKGDHLAFIGRANPEKGPEVAIAVAQQLGRELVMALKVNEPDEQAYWTEVLAPLVRGAGIEVRLRTSAVERARIMGEAAVVLFPIQWPEPFGLVPVEANACGTPVVATANGAAPELIVDGVTGYCVSGGTTELCAAVEQAAGLSPAACRAHVTEHLSAAKMVTSYERIYQQVLGDHPHSLRAGHA
jgi:glycosyltransferase involved in cell wall biosynthesis